MLRVVCEESLRICGGGDADGGGVWVLGALIRVLMLFIRPPKKDVFGLEASAVAPVGVAAADDDGGGLGEE